MTRRWYSTDMSAEKKMMIGRTLTAKLKPILSTSARGPNTMSMPACEKSMTACTPVLMLSMAALPQSEYRTKTATATCSANAAATMRRLIALRLLENRNAIASNTTIPTRPIRLDMVYPVWFFFLGVARIPLLQALSRSKSRRSRGVPARPPRPASRRPAGSPLPAPLPPRWRHERRPGAVLRRPSCRSARCR